MSILMMYRYSRSTFSCGLIFWTCVLGHVIVQSHKAVVFMHGIFGSTKESTLLESFIKQHSDPFKVSSERLRLGVRCTCDPLGYSRIMLLISLLQLSILSVLLAAANLKFSNGPKAIVFIHGILGNYQEGSDIQQWVSEVHPDTPFYSIALYQRINSLAPLWKQVETIKKEVEGIMSNHTNGIHLICFSQGGLICRGILSTTQHNVDTFIALSCPLAGQYGDTSYLKHLFPNFLKSELYRVLYTKPGQDISIGNYWKDPHHLENYQKHSNFLAPLNNDTYTQQINDYKKNFLRLSRIVLIGGPDDGVITPWESSHFAFYDSNEKVVEFEQQRYFLEDSFGLKTLFSEGKIKIYVIPGVQHVHWHSNRTVFNSAILPWLI